jgi:hypothetical protein
MFFADIRNSVLPPLCKSGARLHPDRAPGGHRHHRNPGRAHPAGPGRGEAAGRHHPVRVANPAIRAGRHPVRQRSRRFHAAESRRREHPAGRNLGAGLARASRARLHQHPLPEAEPPGPLRPEHRPVEMPFGPRGYPGAVPHAPGAHRLTQRLHGLEHPDSGRADLPPLLRPRPTLPDRGPDLPRGTTRDHQRRRLLAPVGLQGVATVPVEGPGQARATAQPVGQPRLRRRPRRNTPVGHFGGFIGPPRRL